MMRYTSTNIVMEKPIHFATCICTQLDSLVKQLIDLVTSCSVNADENLEFRLAHDILFREVKLTYYCHA